MIDLLKRFQNVKSSGTGFTAQCPAHDDKQNSLSIAQQNGKWLIKCVMPDAQPSTFFLRQA